MAYIRLIAILVGVMVSAASSAGVTVGVNKLSVVHKSSSGMTIAFPDVCKTPTPGGPVPIPYPNVAKSTDTTKGTKQTKVSPLDSQVDKAKQPRLSSGENARTKNVVRYSLESVTKGKLLIQQTAGKDSVTTATYVDDKGNSMRLREHALIKLANGDLCAICAAKDGRVTAVYRLLPDKKKRESR